MKYHKVLEAIVLKQGGVVRKSQQKRRTWAVKMERLQEMEGRTEEAGVKRKRGEEEGKAELPGEQRRGNCGERKPLMPDVTD